jgi:hypothetical protein
MESANADANSDKNVAAGIHINIENTPKANAESKTENNVKTIGKSFKIVVRNVAVFVFATGIVFAAAIIGGVVVRNNSRIAVSLPSFPDKTNTDALSDTTPSIYDDNIKSSKPYPKKNESDEMGYIEPIFVIHLSSDECKSLVTEWSSRLRINQMNKDRVDGIALKDERLAEPFNSCKNHLQKALMNEGHIIDSTINFLNDKIRFAEYMDIQRMSGNNFLRHITAATNCWAAGFEQLGKVSNNKELEKTAHEYWVFSNIIYSDIEAVGAANFSIQRNIRKGFLVSKNNRDGCYTLSGLIDGLSRMAEGKQEMFPVK